MFSFLVRHLLFLLLLIWRFYFIFVSRWNVLPVLEFIIEVLVESMSSGLLNVLSMLIKDVLVIILRYQSWIKLHDDRSYAICFIFRTPHLIVFLLAVWGSKLRYAIKVILYSSVAEEAFFNIVWFVLLVDSLGHRHMWILCSGTVVRIINRSLHQII